MEVAVLRSKETTHILCAFVQERETTRSDHHIAGCAWQSSHTYFHMFLFVYTQLTLLKTKENERKANQNGKHILKELR